MIKIEALEQEDRITIYVESNKESDIDELDLIYQAVMSNRPKDGGFITSTKFNVVVLKEKEKV